MVVRLAFAVAIHVDPEVLLVDEALAVGDIYFRHRCMRKVHELRARGVTIVFVSHAIGDVKAIGDRVLWLEHGRAVAIGDTDVGAPRYLAAMTEKDSATAAAPAKQPPVLTAAQAVPLPSPNPSERRPPPRRCPRRNPRHRDPERVRRTLHLMMPRAASSYGSASAPTRILRGPWPASCCAITSGSISPIPTRHAKATACRPCARATSAPSIFSSIFPELYPGAFSFSPFVADGRADVDVRLDRQRHHGADGARRRPRLRLHPAALPRRSQRAGSRAG